MKAIKLSTRHNLRTLWIYALLWAVSFVVMLPLLFLVSTSLKEAGRELSLPPGFIPERAVWNNYLELFRQAPFGRWYLNSFLVTILSVVELVEVKNCKVYFVRSPASILLIYMIFLFPLYNTY